MCKLSEIVKFAPVSQNWNGMFCIGNQMKICIFAQQKKKFRTVRLLTQHKMRFFFLPISLKYERFSSKVDENSFHMKIQHKSQSGCVYVHSAHIHHNVFIFLVLSVYLCEEDFLCQAKKNSISSIRRFWCNCVSIISNEKDTKYVFLGNNRNKFGIWLQRFLSQSSRKLLTMMKHDRAERIIC